MNTSALPIGTVLQSNNYRYRIERMLGQGSFGITYEATLILTGRLGELVTNQRVAIKEFFMRDFNIRDGLTVIGNRGDDNNLCVYYRRKFINEALALSKLDHRHIVKVIELFETNETAYYAMEFCEGGSLDTLIEKYNGLPEKLAIQYFRQITQALTYMHRHRMLHLDLKPSNIVLRNSQEAVIIDFGLVKRFDDKGNPESSTTIGRGTPGYAPIEQMHSNDKDFPVTMDVYALGATLFKMFTGVRPPDAADILNNGFPKHLLLNKGVDQAIVMSIMQAMSLHRNDRYQSVEEFIHDIDKYYDEKQSYHPEPPINTSSEKAQEYYIRGVKLYESGQPYEAMKLFEMAAAMKYAPAYCFIGYCYSHGTGVELNYKKAIEWYKKASDCGDSTAQCNLGYIYQNGLGVDTNFAKAISYYTMAAMQNNIDAQCNLANCYMHAPHSIRNEALAIQWYHQAAEHGSADAQYNLGICYEQGYGVARDIEQAIKWYSRAAEQGHNDAIEDLNTIIDNDTVV